MNVLKKPVQPTAPEVAYLWLRDAITSLPWDEEAFLSENAVAEASGTSRTPVREALLRLEAEGLLRRVPRRGAYVPALSEKDIDAMMEARRVIEEWAVRKVTGSSYSTRNLEDLLARQSEIISDPVQFIQCDIDFHKDIVTAAGNPVLAEVYGSLRYKQLRMGVRAIRDSQGRSDHVLAEHRSIVEAIQSGDPLQAAQATGEHLASTLAALKAPGS
ncbi:GntR family transcriptional regulator [Arthrobacter mobilis]|uniref:GntR family transcriptional regulator n=1 Tax=Arthrobacter mobilis TaxID=2724944 RepID=A0A7X6HDJ9_9MICC|nr:GntR family transcriptional regulator [Arthrobacter mobilis]NKX53672.1 GntR family transcriptional regulator [Arthrobacter mobilis]